MAFGDKITWPAELTTLPTVEHFPDDLLNQQDMAAFLKMHVNSFRFAVAKGHLPDGIDYGAGKRWSKSLMFVFIYRKAQDQANSSTQKVSVPVAEAGTLG